MTRHAPPAIEPHCDYVASPLGIDTLSPRLGWRFLEDAPASSRRGRRQSACQIRVASSPERLETPDLWDTGKTPSDHSFGIPYEGPPLTSRQRCHWQARVWDERDVPGAWCPPQTWEMGLLSPADWAARWIGYTGGWNGQALYFRSRFALGKPVVRARAYIAGLGCYELRLNGRKVGDHVLDPAWTDYSRRVLYVTHDIGDRLRQGVNVVGVIVGNGWHGQPKLLLQIEITHPDGSRTLVATEGGHSMINGEWFVSSGPITRNSIYDGETCDARLEKDGWDWQDVRSPMGSAGLHDMWQTAVEVPPPGGRLVAQALEPIKIVEILHPERLTSPSPGVHVFDAGQNLAGWAELRAKGEPGTCVTLRFAEHLSPDGTINQENLQKAAQTDACILKGGEAGETWEPRFTYHGFRYVQVEGLPGEPASDTLALKRVRSAVEPAGAFRCGNELLNRIEQMVVRSETGNLHGVPTDCPQRGERLGWLNDMTVRSEQALYHFRLPRFYRKWIADIADTQDEAGRITDTAPFKWGKRPADPVSASYLLVAWHVWLHYGDDTIIREHRAGFARWVNYLLSRSEDGILAYSSWGDWAPPVAFAIPGSVSDAVSSGTPGPLVSTAHLHWQLRLLADMARVLDDPAEAARREAQAAAVASAFNRSFWDEAAGGYGSNNQACNAIALHLGLAPAGRIPRTLASLVRAVEANDGHLSTGNLATKYLLEALSEHGRTDIAYRIATQTTYPSWGYMLENGATTLWERWEHVTGSRMNSHNHPMLGSVSSWMFKYLAGIRPDPEGPGFRRFVIRPHPVEGLDWAEAEYRALPGTIRSAWRRDSGRLVMQLSVPPNATARVHVPCGEECAITERGIPLAAVDGVRVLPATATGQGETVIETGSGDYELTVG
ncbi:alpha-L-rhamnosidase [Opitutaceae bacterium TAV5]|nr:alpha-L-rhamnosidase [Opitutaceae bacterium TAV5]